MYNPVSTTLKCLLILVGTFAVFLAMRSLLADVGGMPSAFRNAYGESTFIRTGTFPIAVVILMTMILLHLMEGFRRADGLSLLPRALRGAFFGLLFGLLWFIGFLELVVVYNSPLERHVASGIRDLVTLTCFGVLVGALFPVRAARAERGLRASRLALAAACGSAGFSLFHWAQYALTLPALEQRVDDLPSVLWLMGAGAWIGVMYVFLADRSVPPSRRAAIFAFYTFGLNWLLYTSFYLLFLDIPVTDTLLRWLFDGVGVFLGLLLFERLQESPVNPRTGAAR
jgi:hypothetical protein